MRIDAGRKAAAQSGDFVDNHAVTEELSGTIERVTYHNEDNGFTVLRVRPRGKTGVVTVVGPVASPAEGEGIVATGEWRDDRTHGRQFAAESILVQQATGQVQVETFLGSGAIRGIGPSTAHLLWVQFRDKVFDILDNEPAKLRQVPGIGPKRSKLIVESWKQQRGLRELMLFLQETGIGAARAGRIQKQFGAAAITVIRQNPYRLAEEVRGIGFATADAVALKLGLDRNSMARLRAGVVHSLNEASLHGHCGMPFDELVKLTAKLLSVDAALVADAIELEVHAGRVARDTLGDSDAIFLPHLHAAEKAIAARLQRMVRGKPPWGEIDAAKAIPWAERKSGIRFEASQRDAIALALRSPISVITGGPGVGKTTIIQSIIRILEAKEVEFCLAAPTGRAAKRLAESTGKTAKTIHRLLEVDRETGLFLRDEANPVECDLLIVDEASMIDVLLMQSLLRGLPKEAALVLVGDVDQLPAVGPGEMLNDVISSGVVPTVRLSQIFRQSEGSRITVNAHRINAGEMPELSQAKGEESDFFFFGVRDSAAAAERVLELVSERIPRRFGLNAIRDIQLLAPMRKGVAGVENLNRELQLLLNPRASSAAAEKIERQAMRFFGGDKVMQTVNNYDHDIFNGDIGFVKRVDSEEQKLVVDFDGREIELQDDEIDDLVLAYATTIHKSQGSEYPAVVVLLTSAHSIMLQRNLLYTAVTRGKRLVVIVGEESAVRQAVRTRGSRRRWTKLREWLQ